MRITSFLSVLFAAPFLLLPSLAMGQEVSFIVHMVKDPKEKLGGYATILVADCGKVDVKAAKPQSVSCTVAPIATSTCAYNCAFTQKSTDTPPFAAVFSWSTYNPTCAVVWDPWAQRYVYRCW
jgi:hypothetical protein